MGGTVQHIRSGALLHHDAPLQDGDAVSDLRHHAEVVSDEQQRRAAAALQVAQQRQHLRLRRDIQRRRRLVGDQHAGFQRQGRRDADALALPAAELVRVGPGGAGRVRKADLVQQVQHPGAHGGARQGGVGAQGFGHLVPHAVQRVQRGRGVLEHHADPRPAYAPHGGLRQRQQVLAVQRDPPARDRHAWRQQAQDGGRQHGLAGPAFANQAQHLPGPDVQ